MIGQMIDETVMIDELTFLRNQISGWKAQFENYGRMKKTMAT